MDVDAPGTDDFAQRLEAEGLIVLTGRPFVLTSEEAGLLTPSLSAGEVKNISLSPGGAVRGTSAGPSDQARLAALMGRFATWSQALIEELAPRYAGHLRAGRTSFRPRAAGDTAPSPRKDDRRLHVDAFASQPTGGARILRVFANINPHGEARVWNVGEPFEAYARRWFPGLRRPAPGEAWMLQRLGITRSRRTAYDFAMLGLHDAAKLDAGYQREAPRREAAFPPGATWIVFTDSTVHAAICGRYVLEQTFYLPVSAMARPEHAPLRVLERLAGRPLA